MSDRIEKTVELNAPVERVWRALTDHKEFGEWFRVKLDGPFVPGEVSTGQITYPGYEHIKWNATIEQMEAPRLFSFRWPHEGIELTPVYSRCNHAGRVPARTDIQRNPPHHYRIGI